ncbi:MAG TPA: HD domain-containing phosphohydrolase, partial [Baekduia sp.]|nr:HD domain-containing phosphohydrolase [Baekduia sp.]
HRGTQDPARHLHTLVATIDGATSSTREHSLNVAAYAAAIGAELGLTEHERDLLHRAGVLHDVGKVCVAPDVLTKPGPLTPPELDRIQLHAEIGATMVAYAGLEAEALLVRHHHERMDGRGYPDGLAGAAIPYGARILFVADAFEAMTSDRPYRHGMPVDVALDELARCAGDQFDPEVVDVMRHLVAGRRLHVRALRHAA